MKYTTKFTWAGRLSQSFIHDLHAREAQVSSTSTQIEHHHSVFQSFNYLYLLFSRVKAKDSDMIADI